MSDKKYRAVLLPPRPRLVGTQSISWQDDVTNFAAPKVMWRVDVDDLPCFDTGYWENLDWRTKQIGVWAEEKRAEQRRDEGEEM